MVKAYKITTQKLASTLLAITFGVSSANQLALVDAVETGVPYANFKKAAKRLDLSETGLAKLVGIASSTLSYQKKTKNARLSVDNSEKLYRYINLLERAIIVLNDESYALEWFRQPNAAFEGKSPAEIARNEAGAQMVLDLLGRVEYGVFS